MGYREIRRDMTEGVTGFKTKVKKKEKIGGMNLRNELQRNCRGTLGERIFKRDPGSLLVVPLQLPISRTTYFV